MPAPLKLAARAVAVALVLALGAAGTAAAQSADDIPAATRFAVGSPAMQVAQQIAVAQWGAAPCGGQIQIEWVDDADNINARSWWANPVSNYGAPEQNTECRIGFNRKLAFSWPKFCTVMVHEYGHLAGHDHAADGADVMSAYYRAPLAACAATPDPTATPTTASSTTTTATPRSPRGSGRHATRRDRAARGTAGSRA